MEVGLFGLLAASLALPVIVLVAWGLLLCQGGFADATIKVGRLPENYPEERKERRNVRMRPMPKAGN